MSKQLLILFVSILTLFSCQKESRLTEITASIPEKINQDRIEKPTSFAKKLSNAALSILDAEVVYTPS